MANPSEDLTDRELRDAERALAVALIRDDGTLTDEGGTFNAQLVRAIEPIVQQALDACGSFPQVSELLTEACIDVILVQKMRRRQAR